MKNIRKSFFKLFLIALLVMPMMVRALPSGVETKSYERSHLPMKMWQATQYDH